VVAVTQQRHECRYLLPGHGSVMLGARFALEQMLKMPFPASGVWSLAQLRSGRPIENLLDARPQPRSCLWRGFPDWRQERHHGVGLHVSHVDLAECLTGAVERRAPLLCMLVVRPGWTVLRDVGRAALSERHRGGARP